MKAVQLTAHGTPGKMQLCDLPDPRPAPDEAVVQVRACGLNHLDLWAEAGALPVKVNPPRVQGCEIAGEILEIGRDVKGWRPGERVAVQSNLFCSQCEFCLKGEESLCLNTSILGVQRDGGFAERVAVPAGALVPLPSDVSFDASAAVTLAGSTAMHMLTHRAEVRAGDWVLVIGGAGGVGSAAVQIAKQRGAYVISTGSTEERRRFAHKLGADYVVDSTAKDWSAEVRGITEKRGVDLVIEHVGGDILVQAFNCLARGGAIVTCGATAGKEVQLNLWPFFVKEHRLIGSYGRNRADMIATLQWVAEGKLKPVIHHVHPLAETSRAFASLRRRQVLGKLVIQP